MEVHIAVPILIKEHNHASFSGKEQATCMSECVSCTSVSVLISSTISRSTFPSIYKFYSRAFLSQQVHIFFVEVAPEPAQSRRGIPNVLDQCILRNISASRAPTMIKPMVFRTPNRKAFYEFAMSKNIAHTGHRTKSTHSVKHLFRGPNLKMLRARTYYYDTPMESSC